MKIKYIDTETTSLNGRVIEYGEVLDDNGTITLLNELIDPQELIAPSAMGIHHITDEMVEGKPTFDEIIHKIDYKDTDYVIAHNAPFDVRMLTNEGVDFTGVKVIDTLAVVKQLMPKVFGDDKLGTLFYGFGLHKDFEHEGDSHRASYDCLMLKTVTERLMQEFDIGFDDMYAMCKPKHISEKECYLKKYKGKTWKWVKENDANYCSWIINNFDREKDAEIIEYLEE